MINPYGLLISGCTGLPVEVTLSAPCNDSSFLPADHQLEQNPLWQRTLSHLPGLR